MVWGRARVVLLWWRTAVFVAGIVLAGCAHGPVPSKVAHSPNCGRDDPIAACTRQPARYPELLIGLADPAAPLIGRTIAMVRFRKGYLAEDEAARELLGTKLEPLDVVLVTSKGRLTGSAIPGLFTHTIAYLGSEAQIRRLGMWNDPGLAPFRDAIHSGKIFVESDKKGVHLSTAQQILNADRVLVLRPRFHSPSWIRKSLLAFLGHVGSRFDFHFNAGESNRLYCSELVFHVLPELKLPVRHFYNRDVVLPDDIAATGLEPHTNLSFVLYMRGGPHGWTHESRRTAVSDLAAEWQKWAR